MIECEYLEKIRIDQDIASKLQWDEEDRKELNEKHFLEVYNCKDVFNSLDTKEECEECPFSKRIRKFKEKLKDKWK